MSDDIVSLVVSDNGKSHVDGQFVGMDIKTKQDNQLYTETLKQIDSKGVLYVNSLKNEDWYQQDLAHLTSNILRSETQQNSDNKTFISGRGYAGIPIQHIDGSVTYFNIMEWQARDEAIATTVDYLQGVYRDILGRDCSIDEIAPTVTKYVFRDDPRFSDYKDKTLQDLRSQVAYSDEAYNRINENVSRIRGYAWNNDAGIRHEQDRLAGGEGFNDLMKNFAYDQESYNRIRDNVTRIRGYVWDNPAAIRHEQDRLAGGEGFNDLMKNFAYDQESYNRIRDNVTRIRGYVWDNPAAIRHEQDRLAGGEGFNDLMKNFAYDQESYNNIAAMNASILGYAVSDATIRQQQAQLANGASFNDLRNKLLNR